MPFLPTSPTRLYTLRRANLDSAPQGKLDNSLIDEMKEAKKPRKSMLLPDTQANATSDGKKVAEEAPSSKKSRSWWREATVISNIASHEEAIPEGLVSQQDDGGLSTSHITQRIPLHADPGFSDTTGQKLPSTDTHSGSSMQHLIKDNASESEYSVEEDTQPIVGRASSVRVSRPRIIDYNYSRVTQHHGDKVEHTGRSPTEAKTVSNNTFAALPSMPEEDGGQSSHSPYEALQNLCADQLTSPMQFTRSLTILARNKSQPTSDGVRSLDREESSLTVALATSSTPRSVHPTIVDPSTSVSASEIREQNKEFAPSQGISRAMSSPFPLPGKGMSRRVTIRPADLVIKCHNGSNSFRESVVTTPYPRQISGDADGTDQCDDDDGQGQAPVYEDSTGSLKERRWRKGSFSEGLKRESYVPSLATPEVLFLDLSLLKHPCARTAIEIQITDKGSFDDEQLFNQIRTAYIKQLLGSRRLLFTLVRHTNHVSITVPSNFDSSEFDSVDFLKHFHNPRLGHRRKAWVIWLRQNNPRTPSRATALLSPKPASTHLRQIDNLSHLSPLRTHGLGQSRHGGRSSRDHPSQSSEAKARKDKNRFSTASDTSSFHFIYSPAIPRLPFLSKSDRSPAFPTASTAANLENGKNELSPCRSFFWPSDLSASLSTMSKLGNPSSTAKDQDSDKETVKIVTVSFHHEFRPLVLGLLTLGVVLQATAASAVWVMFGVPGTRPGMDWRNGGQGDWQIDARARVLTGVIIGLVVLLVGCLMEGMLIWGSWLLL